MANPDAESASAEGWVGLEAMHRGEFGIRRGPGRTGEYAFCWRGQSSGIHSEWIPIKAEKIYELGGWFKAEPGSFAGLTFGVLMADAQQRDIRHWNVFSVKGTRTELAAPCRAGDRVLRIKDGAVWQSGASLAAAFGVGENELTFDVTPLGIEAVRPDGETWSVTLKNPCGLDMPAGASVHQNRAGNGGIFLSGAVNAVIPDEWTELKGLITPKQWWPGTAFARVVVIGPGLRGGANASTLLLDDFALKIVE